MERKIGIAGLGGIGSRVAELLVRSGEQRLTLIDFDRVEPSNLNRQFYFAHQTGGLKTEMLKKNLQQIRPLVEIETKTLKIDKGNICSLFSDCTIIVEGFDRKESKKMLVETFARTEKQVVSASGIAGFNLDAIGHRQIGNCTIVGDFSTDEAENPLFPPKVLVVAAMMAGIVLKTT
ncbi:MAG: sulfur carrier protein ThiS adenylyltransferase ThiF [Desulfobacterium sp.]|nr:sulfur carrier protein ThiS adenylyltransferase ThiF [Desulfobacterium sp.]